MSISTKFNDIPNYVEKGATGMLTPEQVDSLYGIKKIVFYKNGLVVERGQRYPMKQFRPTPRKGVYEMSKKSKLLLTHIVANSDIKFSSMFTLTYGDFFIPYNGKELKRQCNVFLTSLRKRFDCEYVWFLEFTKKGRPHLHVINTIVPNFWDREWLGQKWAKISVVDYATRLLNERTPADIRIEVPIDQDVVLDEARKVNRVHTHKKCWEAIYKADGAQRYCLKYASKEEQKLLPIGFENVGRFWGTSRRVKPIPIASLEIGETMSEDRVREIISETFVGQFELIPKYIFQKDAVEFFTSRGLLLTQVIVEESPLGVATKGRVGV